MADPDPVDELPAVIGEICIMWSHIESRLRDICISHAISRVPVDAIEHVRPILELWSANLGEKQLISISIATLFDALDRDNFDIAQRLINSIDNDLRGKRNRCVHDLWIVYPDRIEKTRYATKVKSTQSRTSSTEIVNVETYSSIDEIRKLASDLSDVHGKLGEYIKSFSLS